ncbi:hypothetical protein [Myceligenerans xiligouense]|uniref:Uncharacterized protein n=1 Tax=Myceligenerans xiligouense TaxID=253184 RepID=A0A3N4Z572_9MICO|nr:hypothetical protein [Myceligenerans xiligouense]RPF20372.1 hypothetical protein EDD34_0962 [Myceligenerans xiligouense]
MPNPKSPSLHAMFVALTEILETLGEDRIARLTLLRGGTVTIEPVHLSEGADIARDLGLSETFIQRLAVPTVADWCGTVLGLECHVRALAGREE